MPAVSTALAVGDWRRRVFALYAQVRSRSVDDPEAAHELWRTGRDALFLEHAASPLLDVDKPGFTGLPIAPYDRAWRFELAIEPAGTEQRLEVATGTDGVVPLELLGTIAVPSVGSLGVWRIATYGGGLFVPLRDTLAGKPGGTYGGGRYVIDTIKGADLGGDAEHGMITVDFNFAYNPSCAYDPAWACPLAPPHNVVGVEVTVGERYSGVY